MIEWWRQNNNNNKALNLSQLALPVVGEINQILFPTQRKKQRQWLWLIENGWDFKTLTQSSVADETTCTYCLRLVWLPNGWTCGCWSRGSCTIRTKDEKESPPQQNNPHQRWKIQLWLQTPTVEREPWMDELEKHNSQANTKDERSTWLQTPMMKGTLMDELDGWTWWGMEQLEHCVGLTNLSQGNQTHWCEVLVQQTEWRESLDRVLFVLIEF